MKRIMYTGGGVALLALGTFAFGDGGRGRDGNNGRDDHNNRGQCVSTCARAAAENRQACARNSSTEQQLATCLATVQQQFQNCKDGCPAGGEDDDE
jgi:hypothetical protein